MEQYTVRVVRIERRDPDRVVKAKTWSPLSAVAIVGCALAVVLLVVSIVYDDGFALLATLMFSCLSTVVGIGNRWKLIPKKVQRSEGTPDGDAVIRYPNGAFLVVKCEENVARELYFAPETIQYWIPQTSLYRMFSLIGTMMLMIGIVALGNARIYLQIAFAGSYMLMNAAYWIVAALPPQAVWDVKHAFTIHAERIVSHSNSDGLDQKGKDGRTCCGLSPFSRLQRLWEPVGDHDKRYEDKNDTFTQALWKVIAVTKSVDWVRRSKAAPQTAAWEGWLQEALEASKQSEPKQIHVDEGKDMTEWKIPDWDAQRAIAQRMAGLKNQENVSSVVQVRRSFALEAPVGSQLDNMRLDANREARRRERSRSRDAGRGRNRSRSNPTVPTMSTGVDLQPPGSIPLVRIDQPTDQPTQD